MIKCSQCGKFCMDDYIDEEWVTCSCGEEIEIIK